VTVPIPADVAAEVEVFNRQAEQLLAAVPPVEVLGVEAAREQQRSAAPPPHPAATTIDDGPVPLRVLDPGGATGLYLHLHGGGWTSGANDGQDPHLWSIAAGAGLVVVSVEYRLAPEHPFPAGADDCEAAARWVLAELGHHRVFIGGESAGAHLSAVTLLRLRGAGFAGANLVYGLYDLGMSASQRAWGDRNLILSTPTIAWHLDQLCGDRSTSERRDPALSPLFADLDGLCPALFSVGTHDPVLDDSRLLAERWEAAGNEATLDVYEGGIHAFNLFPTRLAEIANHRQIAWLRTH
jgi:acetyl esterase